MTMDGLRTERLLLRRWQPSDAEPFAELNGDPDVMRHMVATMTRQQSDQLIATIERGFEVDGFGLWAVEVRATDEPVPAGTFVGFVGLARVPFEAGFTPAVEVGWRLSRQAWHRGYATEAARRAIAFGFTEAGLDEIVSFTIPANEASQAVMQRLGMVPDGTFEHPRLMDGHPKRTHVLYRLDRATWEAQQAGDAPSQA
ncbi:MAG: GNAT family N-acetyltransferase [Acidimicrobiales bacterium]|nr:GNAT family N-acetyltransferase [Acidimicrobiales bacterium]